MTSDALASRCEELRQPVLDLVETGILATMKPSAVPQLAERIESVRAVLAAGTAGIAETAYLDWHPVAVATLHRMEAAARAGDAAGAWALFTDPNIGFNPLGEACQGVPGW
ncbi:hypothetical protein [Agromyces humatus]|uniref:Uncharacterized protein n=1 Tax=Agromyces humatus TaxID=279573 RepID=A0ABN2KUM9_9MICO|nr:hypothetical protein [Agromyces humatus]